MGYVGKHGCLAFFFRWTLVTCKIKNSYFIISKLIIKNKKPKSILTHTSCDIYFKRNISRNGFPVLIFRKISQTWSGLEEEPKRFRWREHKTLGRLKQKSTLVFQQFCVVFFFKKIIIKLLQYILCSCVSEEFLLLNRNTIWRVCCSPRGHVLLSKKEPSRSI